MDANYYKSLEPFFGSWRITRLIGEGSFGKVFEIEREDFGRVYKAALKAITIPQNESEIRSVLADGMDMQSATTYYKGFVEEVVDEFALMAQLKGNSNIVSYEDHVVVEHKDNIGWDILIRMELLTPLLDYTTQGQMSQDDILKLGIDICKALEYCKAFNIIHRDIKPENIFISPSGDYKLGDFGIARTVEKTTSGMSKKGTYTYMAPEVYKEQPYGPSVDIYSLGIVLYRLVNNNRAPFLPAYPALISHSDRENSIARRIGGEPIPMLVNGDKRLGEIILKACAYAPEDRYASPEEMRRDLEELLTSHPQASFTVNPVVGHVTEKTAQNPALQGQPQQSGQSQWGTQPQQTAQPQWGTQPQQTAQPQEGTQPQQSSQPQYGQISQPQPEYGTDEDATVFLFGDNREKPDASQEATVVLQPEEETQAESVKKEKEKSKKVPLLIGGGVAAAVIIGIVVGVSRSGGSSAAPSVHYASSDSNTEDTTDLPENTETDSEAVPEEASAEPAGSSDIGFFNELLYGEFVMEPVDSSDADENAPVIENAEMFEYNEYWDKDFFVFPEDMEGASTNLDYSGDTISYSEENFFWANKEEQPGIFADMVYSQFGYDDLEYAEQFYKENMAGKMDSMDLTYADRTGDLYESMAYYEIADGELILYRPVVDDDTGELSLQSTTYGISWDNYTFQLSKNGMTARYAPDGFEQGADISEEILSGYASSDEDVYQDISYMELPLDPNADAKVYFKDGTSAISPKVEFSDINTATVSWEGKVSMMGVSEGIVYEETTVEEPASITFRYIPNPETGFILISSDGIYKYQLSYDGYYFGALYANLDSDLLEDGKISSIEETMLQEYLGMQGRIQKQLIDSCESRGIDVKIEDGLIALDSSILFEVDQAELSEEGKAYLDAFVDVLGTILAEDSDFTKYISKVIVTGYTDSSGDDDYNMQLSEKRAQTVVDYCCEKDFIMPFYLKAQGGGETNLIYDESGAEDRDASRRVEFKITY